MTLSNQNRKKAKKALALLVSSALLCAPLALLSGCGETEEPTTDPTVTQTDTQTIRNGNFEFYDTSEGKNLIITSPSGWTKSVGTDKNGGSAIASTRDSGIVNTNKSDWESLTQSKIPLTKENAAAEWDNASLYDRLKFYDEAKIDSTDDFEDYIAYNIDFDDIPDCANPLTHAYDGAADAEADTSVLMIRNYRTDRYGTAQRYASSTTVTLPANTSAKLSVWVKTSDLKYNNETPVSGNRGAYLSVAQTLGNRTLSPLEIKNIDTSAVTDNNGWVEYSLYLRGDVLIDSTFSVTLGLGQGGGNNKFEYVEGYAFFDDLRCEIITDAEYEAQSAGALTASGTAEAEARIFETDKAAKGVYAFASDLSFAETALASSDLRVESAPTVEQYGTVSYTSVPDGKSRVYRGLSLDTANDLLLFESVNEISARGGNRYLDRFVSDGLEAYPFDRNGGTVLLLSAGGAAYTAKVNSDAFVLAPESYLLVSFYVKTSALKDYTGATVSLVDGEDKSTIAAFDTTTLDTVDTDETKDVFDGWKKCAFLVSNPTDSDKVFSLELSYGPTTIVGTTNASYLPGYAAFTAFSCTPMEKTAFDAVTTGAYIQSVALYNNTAAQNADGFDSVIYSDESAIESGFGTPKNYIGVDGGSSYVGGTDYSYANTNPNAGLLNRAHAATYWDENAAWTAELLRIACAEDASLTNALNADNWWSRIIGSANQPLLIVNTVEQAYGYIAASTASLSANAYTTVSVKVKVSRGAVAYVYLMDASSLTDGYNDPLAIETPKVTYWYDENNNVCALDPASDDFNERRDVVYLYNNNDAKLEANGLYRRADGADDKNYANLSAYTADDEGNLVTESEQIAFWFNPADDAYYARYDADRNEYSVPVSDFDHAYARYTAQRAECCTVVDGDDVAGKWVTVNFFIHTGAEAKNYRLEVFSGSRDGSVKSEAGSYVLFDANTAPDLSSNYSGLLDDAVDALQEQKPDSYADDDVKWYDKAIYYTYTFRDDAAYLRYDAARDAEDEGDLYADYNQLDYEETIAYLYYEDRTSSDTEYTFSTFADLSPIDVTVTPSDGDVDEPVEDAPAPTPDYDVWLLASSILLAVVLLLVLGIVLGRKIAERLRVRRVHKTNATVSSSRKQKYYKRKLKLND